MESLSQTGAESSTPPPDPGPSDRDSRMGGIKKTLIMLRGMTDSLLERYQEAGIKWHLIPVAARASQHNDLAWIDALDEIYSIDSQGGGLAECVYELFGRLVPFVIDGQKALDRGDKHLGAAQVYMDSASYEARKLEKKITASEGALADVIAVRNALEEQDLMAKPEVWLDVKLECFEDWLAALSEAQKGWRAMKS